MIAKAPMKNVWNVYIKYILQALQNQFMNLKQKNQTTLSSIVFESKKDLGSLCL